MGRSLNIRAIAVVGLVTSHILVAEIVEEATIAAESGVGSMHMQVCAEAAKLVGCLLLAAGCIKNSDIIVITYQHAAIRYANQCIAAVSAQKVGLPGFVQRGDKGLAAGVAVARVVARPQPGGVAANRAGRPDWLIAEVEGEAGDQQHSQPNQQQPGGWEGAGRAFAEGRPALPEQRTDLRGQVGGHPFAVELPNHVHALVERLAAALQRAEATLVEQSPLAQACTGGDSFAQLAGILVACADQDVVATPISAPELDPV